MDIVAIVNTPLPPVQLHTQHYSYSFLRLPPQEFGHLTECDNIEDFRLFYKANEFKDTHRSSPTWLSVLCGTSLHARPFGLPPHWALDGHVKR